MDGNWWKCSGSRLGIGFAPKSLFAVKNKPNVPKKSETTKKTSSDAVSLTSVKTDFQNDIINKNFKLKKVEKTDDSQFSDQPPLKPKPVEKFLAEPQTNEEEEKGDQTIRNTVNMRRRASRNQTPNIATVSQVQRPEMTDLINSISSRIESNNKSKFNIKGNRKSMIEGQGLMITSKSSKNEVRAWLEAIGDITELTIDALAALDGNLLFQLTKTDLQQICDNDWHRIYGHINIQKNLFEKSHTSALEEKLRARRLKNEQEIGVIL